jgi:hypothetical protein
MRNLLLKILSRNSRNLSGCTSAVRLILVFTLTALSGFFLACNVKAETYYGQVIDEETGKPLEGAGVTVIWYRVPYVYMDVVRRFQSAQETLTDRNGKFSLEASPGIDWNPITYILKEPELVIFKPGYEPLRNGFVKDSIIPNTAFKNGTVVKLPKLQTREEQKKFVSFGSVGITAVPPGKIPILTKLLNIHAESLGLKPMGRNTQ